MDACCERKTSTIWSIGYPETTLCQRVVLPVAIVGELVVTGHGDETAICRAKWVEDLSTGLTPYLTERERGKSMIEGEVTSHGDDIDIFWAWVYSEKTFSCILCNSSSLSQSYEMPWPCSAQSAAFKLVLKKDACSLVGACTLKFVYMVRIWYFLQTIKNIHN